MFNTNLSSNDANLYDTVHHQRVRTLPTDTADFIERRHAENHWRAQTPAVACIKASAGACIYNFEIFEYIDWYYNDCESCR